MKPLLKTQPFFCLSAAFGRHLKFSAAAAPGFTAHVAQARAPRALSSSVYELEGLAKTPAVSGSVNLPVRPCIAR